MLHQIRKMIGLAVAIMRGFATKDTMENAFKMERVDIPIAPGLNLLLEQVLKTCLYSLVTAIISILI